MPSDIAYGFRRIRRNKLLNSVLILLLGIGIGANVLIFSFVNALLLKPLPVRDPGNLFLLEENTARQVRPEYFVQLPAL